MSVNPDNVIKMARSIQLDIDEDVKQIDGSLWDARTAAMHFGQIYAAVSALAHAVELMAAAIKEKT